MEAVAFWQLFPRQIASDLRRFFPGCCIRDWHQGRLSSFDLLELFGVSIEDDPENEERTITIEWPPDDGAVAMAIRDGERAEWKQMLAQIANISALFRSAKFPKADTDEYGERLFFPASRIREFTDVQRAIDDGDVIMFPGEEG